MILDKFSLKGKVAIVTGASRGIGKAMSLALAEAGADVAVAARTLSKLEELQEQIRSLGRNCFVCQADVTRSEDRQHLVGKTAGNLGRVDILVNNAGMNVRKLAIDYSEAEWDRVLDTNLKAYFFCAQAAAKEMAKRNSGAIINISSLRSLIAPPMAPAYTASKGGVSQLTKALAVEWARYGIRVNAISPGYTETELTAHFKEKEKDQYEAIRQRTALKRWAVPEDLTGLLIYLASDASQYVTGQTIYVDGGYALT
jgi:NAD(P)-dependent dehydrogenase (short-subunit alcohol dehydrogenase family)